jgi:hypothetical protein
MVKLKIDAVFEAVYKKRNEISIRDQGATDPNLVIYMSPDFYHDCMSEICGGVNIGAYEFVREGTIKGFTVYIVPGTAALDKTHPPYRVFEI